MLVELFADPAFTRAIVFTRTKRGADRVARSLDEAGIGALAIHGNKSQGQRERALAAFRSGQARAMVATDIAARGIDIDDVSHVVNFELPDVAEAYVHRIGRTARAGKGGKAISFCDASEREFAARDRAPDADAHLCARSSRRKGPEAGSGGAQGDDDRDARPAAPFAPSRSARGQPAAASRAPGPPHAAGLSGQSRRAGALTRQPAKQSGRGVRARRVCLESLAANVPRPEAPRSGLEGRCNALARSPEHPSRPALGHKLIKGIPFSSEA